MTLRSQNLAPKKHRFCGLLDADQPKRSFALRVRGAQAGCFAATKSTSECIADGVSSGLVVVGPASCSPGQYPSVPSNETALPGALHELERGAGSFEDVLGHQDAGDVIIDSFDFDKWASLAPIAALARRKAAYRDRVRGQAGLAVRSRAPREPPGRDLSPLRGLSPAELSAMGHAAQGGAESPQQRARPHCGPPVDQAVVLAAAARHSERRSASADLVGPKVHWARLGGTGIACVLQGPVQR